MHELRHCNHLLALEPVTVTIVVPCAQPLSVGVRGVRVVMRKARLLSRPSSQTLIAVQIDSMMCGYMHITAGIRQHSLVLIIIKVALAQASGYC